MPYEKSDEKLNSLLKEALQDPEIQEGINRAKLDLADVYAEAKKSRHKFGTQSPAS